MTMEGWCDLGGLPPVVQYWEEGGGRQDRSSGPSSATITRSRPVRPSKILCRGK